MAAPLSTADQQENMPRHTTNTVQEEEREHDNVGIQTCIYGEGGQRGWNRGPTPKDSEESFPVSGCQVPEVSGVGQRERDQSNRYKSATYDMFKNTCVAFGKWEWKNN